MYWKAFNAMTPDYWPTVFMQDNVGMIHPGEQQTDLLGPEFQVFAIGLNLYLVSLNCKASKIRHPLADPNRRTAAVLDAGNVKFASETLSQFFNGVIFANGTVNPNSDPDFRFNDAIHLADCK